MDVTQADLEARVLVPQGAARVCPVLCADAAHPRAQAKPKQPLILANGTALMLWWLDGQVYCTAANGTAFQYPLVDGELVPGAGLAGGPAVRSPLDGTLYDLASGKVLDWCPKEDAPLSLRNMLAGLKQASPAVDLPVFATRLRAGGALEVLIPVKA